MATKKVFDVIVVGAGAAGLACAQRLIKAGKKVLVIEARARVGGRAYTLKRLNSYMPVELGAEFIHGCPPSMMDLAKELRLPFYDVCDKHYFFDGTKTPQPLSDFWPMMQVVIDRIPGQSNQDSSVADFISSVKFSNAQQKELFTAFVEGFHAADLTQMSLQGLRIAEEVKEENSLNGSELFRFTPGYNLFFQSLLQSEPKLFEAVQLNTVVKKIDLRKKEIALTCRSLPEAIFPNSIVKIKFFCTA